MEVLTGREAVIMETPSSSEIVSLGTFYEVENFELKAYHELEAFFEVPTPFFEIELTSAGVFVLVGKSKDILLVQTSDDSQGRRVELPAGKRESSDEDIFHTGQRELFEETGLKIEKELLKPFHVRHHEEGKGGLQFITQVPMFNYSPFDSPPQDELGRSYFLPEVGTDNGKTKMLITEPIEVFINSKLSLLSKYSRNQWAVDYWVKETLRLYINDLNNKK